MISSYKKNNFCDLLSTLVFLKSPKKIVEFGILNGYSIDAFIKNKKNDCHIHAYDIFEKFNGNYTDYDAIIKKYKDIQNIHIHRGDYYDEYNNIENSSIDILHIDIANDADVYQFCLDNYYDKIVHGGLIILEGGSEERDNVEWMLKYNKKPIKKFLDKISDRYTFTTVENFPSITIIIKQ